MKLLLSILLCTLAAGLARADLFINEIDYDNNNTDSNEWVEITGTAGQSLNGYSLVFINQAGSVYNTFDLTPASFTFSDETGTGWGFFVVGIVYPGFSVSADFLPAGWTVDEIQNGPTDSIQLTNVSGSVSIHLIDYEGDNTATTEDQQTALGDNNTDLQTTLALLGTGAVFSAFTFDTTVNSGTPGALNFGQVIIPEPASVSLMVLGVVTLAARRRIHAARS
jgi:hypothetical protein